MKYQLIITLFSLSSLTYGQIVSDMAALERPVNEIKNGTYYIKDVNNNFSPFLGSWNYINGDTEFRITISKVAKHHITIPQHNINYYQDGLKIKYKKYQGGELVFSSPEDDLPSGVSKAFGTVYMSFTDYQRNSEIFPLELKLIPVTGSEPVPAELSYKLFFSLENHERTNSYFEQHPDESYFSVPNKIEMTKMTGFLLED